MLAELIDRRALKEEARQTLWNAQVSPKGFTALFFALVLALNLVDSFTRDGVLSIFVMLLSSLLSIVLEVGFALYFMTVRRGERAEYLCLFDGFSMAGKVVALAMLKFLFIFLWSMLFTIPGIVAAYRFRFAVYNLCENPELSPLEALNMSKRQTLGYKSQLFGLDISYLGWTLLASLPQLFYNSAVVTDSLRQSFEYYGMGFPALPAADVLFSVPLWGWTLLIGVWMLVVSLFYRPVYQCTELGYFETAKRTSGVGAGVAPVQSPPPPWGGSDGL